MRKKPRFCFYFTINNLIANRGHESKWTYRQPIEGLVLNLAEEIIDGHVFEKAYLNRLQLERRACRGIDLPLCIIK